MKTLRRLSVLVVVLAALALAARWLWQAPPPSVTVHVVARGAVESTVANTRAGTVQANRRAKLAPSAGGLVARLLVTEGDRVAKGQLLIELWHDDLDAQLALARSESDRAAALAEQASLTAALAGREAKRQRDLHTQGIGSEDTLDRIENAAETAMAAARAAAAEAASRREQIAVLEAQVERMLVTAPFAGIVAEVNGEVGEFVTPSPVGIPTPPAVDLIDDGAPYVTAPIDEVDAAKVLVGASARIALDAFGGRSFAGRVRRIAPYVLDREKQARTVDVEVEFAEPAGVALLPGYSADVEILIEARANVLRVPGQCLRDGEAVLVVGADGVLERRAIEVGLANWRFAEVRSGLAEGERVVLGFEAEGVAAGVRVRVAADGSRP